MKSVHFVCLFVILSSIMLAAQSNTVVLINQPVTNKVSSALSKSDPKIEGKVIESYGKLPLSFERNQGQADARVKFLSRGSGYTLYLTNDEAVFSLRGGTAKDETFPVARSLPADGRMRPSTKNLPFATNAILRMKLVNANRAAEITGADELPGKSNYFIGNDPKKWHANVPTFAKVKYKSIYSGIDLVYYGNQRQLEYDFVVAPGADPRRIQFDVRGAKKISRNESGDLVAQMDGGEIRWHKPVVYQEKGGRKQQIESNYLIRDENRVGFEIADYDLRKPLFIDPLIYSTYLGGRYYDLGSGIAVDSAGNAYVTGQTGSANFPTKNPLQPANAGHYDAFVAELNPTGSALVYSTYLGGNGVDFGYGIVVDGSGNAYVTGQTGSSNFPTMNPLQAHSAGGYDAFVAELNPTGSALVYSTYLGGSSFDQANGIAVDSTGNAYVTGFTNSTDFPTMNPLQAHSAGGYDAFVAELNYTGSALVYSTYLGGSVNDYGIGIAADSSGNAYVTGGTNSTDFPTMNPLQADNAGGADVFVAKFNPTGSALVYSTYLGGSSGDGGSGVAVDSAGNAYVIGYTNSTNFPTMNPLQANNSGNADAFVAKVNPTGSALVYSTYLGGSSGDAGGGIAVDSSDSAYVTGYTQSTDFPTVNPLQAANAGSYDAFVAELSPTGSALVYSTYLGGSSFDQANGIAVDSAGNAYVIGVTGSTNFPTMNPLQAHNAGVADVFVGKIAKPSPFVTLAPSKLGFGNQTVGITSAARHSTLTNIGELKLTITSIKVTGSNSSDFVEKDNCGTSVLPKGTCTITVTFTPSARGTRTAAVSITDNAPHSPQKVPLTGTGTYVKLSPPSINFGTQPVGTRSLPQTVTLTNKGDGPVNITGVSITGLDAGDFAEKNNCGKQVLSGASCFIKVTFKPLKKGLRTANVSVSDDGGGSPQKMILKGTGT